MGSVDLVVHRSNGIPVVVTSFVPLDAKLFGEPAGTRNKEENKKEGGGGGAEERNICTARRRGREGHEAAGEDAEEKD